MRLHPHYDYWLQIHSLVLDGIMFSKVSYYRYRGLEDAAAPSGSRGRACPDPPFQCHPYNGTLCADAPCLFDVSLDPHEKSDVAAQHPELVAKLHARLMTLLEGEVSVAASGLCPTPLGTKVDARMSALAAATGFWQPWLTKASLAHEAAM